VAGSSGAVIGVIIYKWDIWVSPFSFRERGIFLRSYYGYDGREGSKVKLFFVETFTFSVATPEAVIPLTQA
jgi:hypothetical protein